MDVSIGPAPARPRLRGVLHQLALPASLPAAVVLVRAAQRLSVVIAVGLYMATMAGMFATSATYHRGAWSPAVRRRIKLADHAAIFAYIAGSYTPFAVLLLEPPWTAGFLAAVWLGAAVGSVVKARRLDRLGGAADWWYVGVGWIGLVALPFVGHTLTLTQALLLVGGGVLFTAGGAILAARRPDPVPAVFGYHELGHAVMLAGTAAHYGLYLELVPAL